MRVPGADLGVAIGAVPDLAEGQGRIRLAQLSLYGNVVLLERSQGPVVARHGPRSFYHSALRNRAKAAG
jgi:hypothetical protein